jgi:hypothetical protein
MHVCGRDLGEVAMGVVLGACKNLQLLALWMVDRILIIR